jgi:hypothetical protein
MLESRPPEQLSCNAISDPMLVRHRYRFNNVSVHLWKLDFFGLGLFLPATFTNRIDNYLLGVIEFISLFGNYRNFTTFNKVV